MTTPTPYTIKVREVLEELCKNTQADYGYAKLVPSEIDQALQQLERLVLEEVVGEKEFYSNHYNFVITEQESKEITRKIARDDLRAQQRAIITNGKE